jgi:ribonuclease HII
MGLPVDQQTRLSVQVMQWPRTRLGECDTGAAGRSDGDLSVTIAAASIVAKVTCDRIMAPVRAGVPRLWLADNKGEGSAEDGLDRLGPSDP